MERARIIRDLIKDNGYKVADIARLSGLPYSTVKYILENGINKAAYGNVCRICSAVGITTDNLEQIISGQKPLTLFTRSEALGIKKYRALDEHGKKLVDTVLNQSYDRVMASSPDNRTADVVPLNQGDQTKPEHLLPNAAHEDNPTPEQRKHADDIMNNDDLWK